MFKCFASSYTFTVFYLTYYSQYEDIEEIYTYVTLSQNALYEAFDGREGDSGRGKRVAYDMSQSKKGSPPEASLFLVCVQLSL